MSTHVMSGRSFTLSVQFSTNVYGSGKTVPYAVISISLYFFCHRYLNLKSMLSLTPSL